MPTPLLRRVRPHSINEFRAAAFQRHADAETLARHGRRTGAIYLWGYAAETVLKAGTFTVLGYHPDDAIKVQDVHAAIKLSSSLNFSWSGSAHGIASWGQLLVRLRADLPGAAYPDPAFGAAVIARSARAYVVWRETLRYHKNVAYDHEVLQVREAVAWLLEHNARL